MCFFSLKLFWFNCVPSSSWVHASLINPSCDQLNYLQRTLPPPTQPLNTLEQNAAKCKRITSVRMHLYNPPTYLNTLQQNAFEIPSSIANKSSWNLNPASLMTIWTSGGHLLWIYFQLIAMSYIARQDQICCDISDPLDRLRQTDHFGKFEKVPK